MAAVVGKQLELVAATVVESAAVGKRSLSFHGRAVTGELMELRKVEELLRFLNLLFRSWKLECMYLVVVEEQLFFLKQTQFS